MARSAPSPCLVFALAVAAVCSGCFYTQGIRGGLEILRQRRPVEKVLEDPATPESLAAKLEIAAGARAFGVSQLGLPDNGSYRHYTSLERPYAVWNVVAAPELSVEPVLWCFPFAGCVSYRGYFSKSRAQRYAGRLEGQGFDVQVAGATTYSTLGRFKDPLLSTFIDLPAAQLAGILFHELAHQKLYVPGDTAFNESFATVVEEEGVRRWLEGRGDEAGLAAYRLARQRQGEVAELLRSCRRRLAELYAGSSPPEAMRRDKEQAFEDLRRQYHGLRESWGGYAGYDAFFAQELNNAHLAAVGAYRDRVPALEEVLRRCSGQMSCFYREARLLGDRPAELPADGRRGHR